jgi:hypothetical protein
MTDMITSAPSRALAVPRAPFAIQTKTSRDADDQEPTPMTFTDDGRE